MYICQAYGLNINSYIPLLIDKKNTNIYSDCDIWINKANEKTKSTQVIDRNNSLSCYLPGIANFIIQNGTHIYVDRFPGISESVLRPCILGSAMSVLLQQRGFLVLHASCVIIDGLAVAFLGNSGAGKSTICSAFHALGYPMLTDDVMAVFFEGDQVNVVPSIPQIKLRSDSAALLDYKKGIASPLHPLSQKKVHSIKQGFSDRSVPLKHIYVLEKGESNFIIPLATQNSLTELIRHTRAVRTLKHQNLDLVHFQKCTTVLQNVSISKLVCKFDLAKLPNVIDLVRSDIKRINTIEKEGNRQLVESTSHNL